MRCGLRFTEAGRDRLAPRALFRPVRQGCRAGCGSASRSASASASSSSSGSSSSSPRRRRATARLAIANVRCRARSRRAGRPRRSLPHVAVDAADRERPRRPTSSARVQLLLLGLPLRCCGRIRSSHSRTNSATMTISCPKSPPVGRRRSRASALRGVARRARRARSPPARRRSVRAGSGDYAG